ncbi:MAG TPA: NAD(P)/FAD-dependent oxidoreductase [Ktedonobacteraceae bacterium]|jgi:pyruvate/2-oxoglutarate dehydrogenase complex dihydrolipoamide dehydrogenase (E3) component|nr:NAD(P)/FAD-dependent oxidoreductase [Ktedonobacteraceae bacterium]
MEQFDIAIIGGGSGGLTAARVAASLGARVLLIDKESLGGDCLHYGCVPSKSLIHVARIVQKVKEAEKFGVTAALSQLDMVRVSEYIQGVIRRVAENERVYIEGVTAKFGKVRFKSADELDLNGEPVRCRKIIIATGSHPAIPDIEGLEKTGYLTNESVFNLLELPASLVSVGGGPVGVELGQALSRLGVKVTIIQGPERILPREDPDVSEFVTGVLRSEGVEVVTGARVVKASRSGKQKVVTAKKGEALLSFEADELLVAVGRRPNVEGLDLKAAGISYGAKGIEVNDFLRTSTPHVFALGDVIGGYLFTHVAAYQAGIAVRNALVPFKKKVNYRVVPWCIFTEPEVARVGLTLDEAVKQHKQARVVTFPWAEIDRAQTEDETMGFIKLVVAGKKDQLVGVHMVGAQAGELLGEMTLAMQNNLTLNDLYNTIHAYPTMSTGIQQAAFEGYLESPTAAQNRKLVSVLNKLRS